MRPGRILHWGNERLSIEFALPTDAPPAISFSRIALENDAETVAALPVVEIVALGTGRSWSGSRSIDSALGRRLRYAGHRERRLGNWQELTLELADEASELHVDVIYRIADGVSALQSRAVVTNTGRVGLTLQSVTSFVAAFPVSREDVENVDIHWAHNDWIAEARWTSQRAADVLPDLSLALHGQNPRGCFAIASHGSWSTGDYLPMGALVNRGAGITLAWQIESGAPWRWELGERSSGLYLATTGPTDDDHQWNVTLDPGESFTTVTSSLALVAGGFDDAIAALTEHRRDLMRPHPRAGEVAVVYNDYMNTIMGDPTTAKLLPLISAAASVGAEYFCVDAGWYDDRLDGWWDSVGEWKPSPTRFPGGLNEVFEAVRQAGMRTGIWLEPEMIGVRSPLALTLPSQAFFQRSGERVVEHERYQLDFRHPAAVAHVDSVVDRLVADFGIEYLKLDYNVNIGSGTDCDGASAGHGLLSHARAYQAWLGRLLDRHPHVLIENCASGGMRMDYALLAIAQLQSVTDQQDMLRMPAIAASAPTAVIPEQGAIWSYPQPDHTDAEIVFTMVTSLLARVHLSGHIDKMSPEQIRLVREAIEVYRSLRQDLLVAIPFWPLGLPRWKDGWICLGMRCGNHSYLAVWRTAGDSSISIPLPTATHARLLYPTSVGGRVDTALREGELTVSLGTSPGAALLRIEER